MQQQPISAPSKELISFLKANESAAKILTPSNKVSDAHQMTKIIKSLHDYRKTNPKSDSLVCQTLFKIHDYVYYRSNDFMRKQVQIATIFGFVGAPTKDLKTASQLMDRIALLEEPENAKTSLMMITQNVLDEYVTQGYQKHDTNRSIASRLQGAIQFIANSVKKKSIADTRWLNENAQKLAKVQPFFTNFSQNFPKSDTYKRSSHKLPLEPVCIYSAKPKFRKNIHSYSYE